MRMNRGEMRTETRVLLGETQQDGYLDTEIDTHLNIGQTKVAEIAGVCFTNQKRVMRAYNAGDLDPADPATEGRYGLPQDFLKVVSIEILQAGTWYPVEILNYQQFFAVSAQPAPGRPRYAKIEFGATTLDGAPPGDIWFHPWPEADNTYTYRISYIQVPTPMTDDGHISEVPHFAHFAVCCFAAMVVSRKHRDRALIQEMSALWQSEIDKVLRVVGSQHQNRPQRQVNVYRMR